MNVSPPEKKILHLDMDAFFAAVEQAANPALRGRPLIVGGRKNRERTVVCAASYEAKRRGVDSGMSCGEAFRLCPDAAFVAADSAKYLYVSRAISRLLRDYSPQVEQASVDEFYLDITGCDHRFGSYEALARHMKQAIVARFHITGSVGISVNRLISKIASKLEKPDGLVILEEKAIVSRLASLAVEKIPGIGGSLSRQLHACGIFTFADLRRASLAFLRERFGKVGAWMYAATHPGPDPEGVSAYADEDEPPRSVGHSYTLPHTIYRKDEICAWLRLLCEMVASRLRRLRLESAVLHLYVRSPDMVFRAKEHNFKSPSDEAACLYERALLILDILKYRGAVRALGVTARRLFPAARVLLLPEEQRRRRLSRAQDAINERFGDWTIHPASVLKAV
jgi:DNA polymerase-4